MIPDPRLTLATALALPTFVVGDMTPYERLTYTRLSKELLAELDAWA